MKITNKLKLFVGILVLVIAIPSVGFAGYRAGSAGQLVGGAECKMVLGNDGRSYPSECSANVYRLTDGGNTCYVSVMTYGNATSISCLRNQ